MAHKLRVIDEMDPTEPGNDPVNLVSVIATVIDDLESAHPTLSIESDLPVAAHVNASPSIRLVFEELLSNAIEHAEKLPGALSIEVSIDRAPDSITVCITDDGPGIHPDELAALRSGDESKLLHTSGAGLWLATWLIELFEGEIEFETDPDHGTTVVIRFHRSSKIEYMAETAQNDMRMFQSETTSSADHPGFSK